MSKQVEAEVKVEGERSDLLTLSLNLNLDLIPEQIPLLLALVPVPDGGGHRDWFR